MGQCNYYLKACFSNADAARVAESRLAELLAEGEKAYNFWQDSRGRFGPSDPNQGKMTGEIFWEMFRDRYPLTIRYLHDLAGIDDWNNGLAGHLSLVDPKSPRRSRPGAILRQQDHHLLLQLNDIWHFSDLTLLEDYCRAELGAINVDSVSEEGLVREQFLGNDPFDALRV